MSVAVYPVFETDVPGFEPYLAVGGKGIGRNLEALEELAHSLKIASLMQFFSTTAEEVAGMMGLEEGETPDFEIVEEWFFPRDALVTIHRLCSHITSHSENVKNAHWILEDLEATSSALTIAEENGTRFHFSLDI